MRDKGLIDSETLNPGLREIYSLAETAAALLNPGAECATLCKQSGKTGGKPECCRERNFTQAEFEYIASSLTSIELHEKATRYASSAKRAGWCPFLGDDGRCEVREVRPLECRVLGDLEAIGCRDVQPDPKSVRVRSSVRENLYKLLSIVAGPGPRRTLGESLLEWRLRYDQATIVRRMP